MNLWIFNHYAAGPNSYGVTRHFDLAKYLVKKGHKVTIFASSFNHWRKEESKDYSRNEFYKIETYDGVRFVWFKTSPYKSNSLSRIKNIFSFYFVLKKFNYKILNEKPDYILGSILHHLSGWFAFKIANKFKAKFIFEERDLWPQTLIDLGKVSKWNPIVKILDIYESFMYKKAFKIIVLFDKADQYVMSKGIDPNKIIYLPNGTDISRFTNIEKFGEVNDISTRLEGKLVIGYVGSHSLANNLDRIIKLAQILKTDKRYVFLFVGEGTYKDEVISSVKDMSLNNCIFLPAVNKEKIPSILNHCDFGIISLKDSPVYNYGFSLNKLYDYLAAKLPVIIDTSVKNNVINSNDLGISSNNLVDLANMLSNLTKEEIDVMKKNASKYVLDNHNWELLADKFESEIFLKGNEINV
ncbi:glycosyltransferase family 4 protein [Jeotgalibacillus marinus]|uniref:Glycosyltransferase family 4 protein n=1 Tax=Jeotgalibacillus marinus TaxID=86667 RepID=A0ABV3Q1V4_9BACL